MCEKRAYFYVDSMRFVSSRQVGLYSTACAFFLSKADILRSNMKDSFSQDIYFLRREKVSKVPRGRYLLLIAMDDVCGLHTHKGNGPGKE